jgi:hypothetical protein
MTEDHRRVDAELTQEVLLDDPSFLGAIVERVVQELLEAEMTEHIGAAPYERVEGRTGHRNGHKPRTLFAPGSVSSTCWCPRTGKAPSPRASSPATRGTRRRSFWR